MSFSSNQLVSSSTEHAVSREDFELLQQFLRVARLLKDKGAGELRHGDAQSLDEYDDDDYDIHGEEGEEAEEEAGENQQSHSHQHRNHAGGAAQQQKHHFGPEYHPQQRQHRNRRQQHQQSRPHAAVEKRYRSELNRKIQQLNACIPESNTFTPTLAPCQDAEILMNAAAESIGSQRQKGPEATARAEKQESSSNNNTPTKSVVLDRAIQYVKHLVSTHEQYQTERSELRQRLQLWLNIESIDARQNGYQSDELGLERQEDNTKTATREQSG